MCFQQVDDYRPPQWPGQEHPQQEHLDFYVDDLDGAVATANGLIGAAKDAVQPGRRIATVSRAAGLPIAVAIMSR